MTCWLLSAVVWLLSFGTPASAAPPDVPAASAGGSQGDLREPAPVGSEKPNPPPFGDIDGDGDVDQDDVSILVRDINKNVGESRCGVSCDIYPDGMITTEDLHKLKDYCTRPNCATK